MKKRKPIKDRCCMNLDCPLHGQFGKCNIRLSFRDIFTSREVLFLSLLVWYLIQREMLTRNAGMGYADNT